MARATVRAELIPHAPNPAHHQPVFSGPCQWLWRQPAESGAADYHFQEGRSMIMRVCLLTLTLSIGLLLGASKCGSAQTKGGDHTAPEVSYCRMVAQVAKFDHQVVKTEAVYRRGGEIMSLYNPSCPVHADSSWVDYSAALRDNTPPGLMEKMDTMLDANGRVRIIAVLEVDGPKPVAIPPRTPPRLADAMRGTNSKWGHQNQFNSRVILLRIISVEPVPSDTPWPK